ncbi:unnamed protein product [Angiostrongylus costaricensis]|uniref:Elongation of very long chain fatty acids protein n=1 Tax=Angiostrongylus costaricensis TaxID=334426 RepID=A0A0R3PEQ9_ANGCS|nr:unnamed protein product [Angiostrongylus costaricensis]
MDFLRHLNEFKAYRENKSMYQDTYRYKYALPFERIDDPRGWTVEVFQRYWAHSITISISYFVIMKGIHHFMEKREPFSLKTTLFLWNTALAVFSIAGFIRYSEENNGCLAMGDVALALSVAGVAAEGDSMLETDRNTDELAFPAELKINMIHDNGEEYFKNGQ